MSSTFHIMCFALSHGKHLYLFQEAFPLNDGEDEAANWKEDGNKREQVVEELDDEECMTEEERR